MNNLLLFSIVYLSFSLPCGAGAAVASWHPRLSPTTNQLRGVAYGNRQFVAVGKCNTVLTSPSGSGWTLRVTGSPSFGQSPSDLFSTTAGEGWFVVGGREGWLIRNSRDGLNWTNGIATIGMDNIAGLAYGRGLFVAVGAGNSDGSGFILSTATPLDFHLVNSARPSNTTNALRAVAFANDQFVAVGERGAIVTSPDGATWTVRNSGAQVALRAVAFHRSRFIAAGDDGIVVASPDGLSWSRAAPASFDVYGLASGPEGLVAVGSFGSAGRLHVSPDGLSWPGTSLVFDLPLNAVVHGPGCFVAVGDGGSVIQSDDMANYWTNSTSARWEEPHWSLGELPSSQQPAIMVVSAGCKTLAVGAATTANYSNALSLESLTIAAPDNSFTQLLLTNAGLTVPLGIASDFSLGPNASLTSFYSRLDAARLLVSGSAAFSSQSTAAFGSIVVGDAASAVLTFEQASIRAGTVTVGSGALGTVNQSNGTNLVHAKLSINGESIYNLTNGFLQAGTLFLGEESRLGGPARFCIWGGSATVTGTVQVGASPQFAEDARGEFALVDGTFQTPRMDFANGVFTQFGGTNQVQSLYLPRPDAPGLADYGLVGGTLVSGMLVLGSSPLGSFVQSGGVHLNSEGILIHGQGIPRHDPWGNYSLVHGRLFSPCLQVYGSFIQAGGTNQAAELRIDMTGSFNLSGGTLVSSNLSIRSQAAPARGMGGTFVQSGGNHTVQNRLLLDGVYRLQSGVLASPDIHIEVDGELHMEGGSLNNPGTFSMDNGTCLALGHHPNLGKLLILRTGILSGFPDQPVRCSLDLQAGSTVLQFLDSHELASNWTGFLYITNWSGSTNGGGTDQVLIGSTAQSLTAGQLSRIAFANPDAFPPAMYPARILATGEVVPGPRPTLDVAHSTVALVLSWTGNYQLFSAHEVVGPYFPVFGASSPYTNSVSGPQRFFQLRSD